MGEEHSESKAMALEAAARELHWKTEHLDPSEDEDWEKLTTRQREFYIATIEWLATAPGLRRLLKFFPDDDVILRRSHEGKEPSAETMAGNTVENKPSAPFEDRHNPSAGDVENLRDWLAAHAAADTVIAGDYTVAQLIEDLDEINAGMWSDGIDAMGDDA